MALCIEKMISKRLWNNFHFSVATISRTLQLGPSSRSVVSPVSSLHESLCWNPVRKSCLTWKFVCYEKKDVPDFINETVKSKKWSTTFGLSPELSDATSNPTIQALIRAYKESGNKEKAVETWKWAAGQKSKIFIGNSVKNSCTSLTGEFTSDQFKHRTDAVKSIGCLTSYADERHRLLSIVAMDYPYR